jgi:ABC-type sulfate/molybdate transport systems ATPase subunit
VVVSHSLGAVQQLCKEVIWLEKGTLKMRGPAADVIAHYTGESYDVHTTKDADLRERWGSGAAHINAIRLLDAAGQVADRVTTNSAAAIVIDVTPQEKLQSPIVRSTISTLDGTVLWSSTSQNAQPRLRQMGEPTTLRVDIDRLPLLEGSYFLSVAVTDATGTTEFDHCRNWVRFDVHQDQLFEEGVVAISSSWTLSS